MIDHKHRQRFQKAWDDLMRQAHLPFEEKLEQQIDGNGDPMLSVKFDFRGHANFLNVEMGVKESALARMVQHRVLDGLMDLADAVNHEAARIRRCMEGDSK